MRYSAQPPDTLREIIYRKEYLSTGSKVSQNNLRLTNNTMYINSFTHPLAHNSTDKDNVAYRRLGRLFSVAALCLLTLTSAVSAQSLMPPDTSTPPQAEKPPVVTIRKTPDTGFPMFKGDEVFYRPDKDWGFKLNLKGFNDLRKKVSGMTIVGFGVREDSVGLTLAHLYVHSMGKTDSITTAEFYANRLYEAIGGDTTVVLSTVAQSKKYGFETLEYDRIEVWPQPDPNNPGKMFDSTLIRHHMNAITTYRNSWIELHLSKTEYHPADSTVFNDLLNTFEITENFKRKRPVPIKVKSVKKP